MTGFLHFLTQPCPFPVWLALWLIFASLVSIYRDVTDIDARSWDELEARRWNDFEDDE